MNASIVLAMPQPRAGAPPARIQKGAPDGFARALAEQRKVCQTAEFDTTNGVKDRNAEATSDAPADVSAHAAEATPQPPPSFETSQSGDASTAETHPSDSRKTASAAVAVAALPSAALPLPMQAVPEIAEATASVAQAAVAAVPNAALPLPVQPVPETPEETASAAQAAEATASAVQAAVAVAVVPSAALPPPTEAAPNLAEAAATAAQAAVATVIDGVQDSVATSNDVPVPAPAADTESPGKNGPTTAQSKNATDVSAFLRVLLNAAEGKTETEPLTVSRGVDADFVAAATAAATSAPSADASSELPVAEANVTSAKPGDSTKAADPHTENAAKVSLPMSASSRLLQHTTPSDTPAAPAATDRISATILQDVAVKGVRYLIGEQEKTISVRLVPPSLGELHIEVVTTGDTLHVRLFSANPVVREALESHLQALRDTFVANNIDVKNISVLSGMAGQTAGHSFANPQFTDATGNAVPRIVAAAPRPAASADKDLSMAYSPPHDGALNVLV